MNDQTIKKDAKKPKLTLVPPQIIRDIAVVREYGIAKYRDPDNWRNVEVERYRDAAFRHFLAYIDDPMGVDDESGLRHLWHLACNVAFLCELDEDSHGVAVGECREERVPDPYKVVEEEKPKSRAEKFYEMFPNCTRIFNVEKNSEMPPCCWKDIVGEVCTCVPRSAECFDCWDKPYEGEFEEAEDER